MQTDTQDFRPSFAGFNSTESAEVFRSEHGGWLFKAEDGETIWFNTSFTPSAIFAHPTTHGVSGELS